MKINILLISIDLIPIFLVSGNQHSSLIVGIGKCGGQHQKPSSIEMECPWRKLELFIPRKNSITQCP